MSTHNIGFHEDLTKIIFELSSNIIKYAPYFFCWLAQQTVDTQVGLHCTIEYASFGAFLYI